MEALKAAVRLLILARLGGTTLLYERLELRSPPLGADNPQGSVEQTQALLAQCGSERGVARLCASAVLYDTPPPHIPTAPNALSVCGEVLHVLRPVVYVGALLRESRSFHPSRSNS